MNSTLGIMTCALAAALAAGPLAAETAPPAAEHELSTVEQQLESSKAQQGRLAAEIAASLAEEEAVAEKLIALSARLQAEETAIRADEQAILELNKEEIVILSELAAKQDVLSELLAGLQRLERNPPPALVVEPGDVLAALRGAMLFGAVVPELRREADELAASLARLDQVRAAARARGEAMREVLARLEDSRVELKALVERKRSLVASGNERLAAEQARAAEFAARATTLKQLIGELGEARARAEAQSFKDAEAAARARQLPEAPKLAFAEARGRLGFPAQGEILRRFGEDDGLGGTFQGLVIATRTDAQVTAPADGEVEFAGAFRSYGQVLILNAGGGYHVLLAGLGEITATTGESLRAGEPVGTMGSGNSSVTLLGDRVQDGRPMLYIEFRNDSEAIDSSPWWNGGMKEAHG